MGKSLLLITLLSLSLAFRCFLCSEIRTVHPKFIEEIINCDLNQQRDDHLMLCSTQACQRRFRAYSDIDFQERDQYNFKFEGVKFGSFYEYLRCKIIDEDLKQIDGIRIALELGELAFPVIKHWLMLDKLMRDQLIHHNEALIEYVHIVLDIKESDPQNRELHRFKVETLKYAIKSHKPLIIIKALLGNIKESLTEKETCAIVDLICASLIAPFYGQTPLPEGFLMLAAALEELNSQKWIENIYEDEENDNPSQVLFVPFFLLLTESKHDAFLTKLLTYCVFDLNRENMEIMSKIFEISQFCSSTDRDFETYKKKRRLFEFIMNRFEMSSSSYEDQFTSAVDRNCLGLVEAFLFFCPAVLEDQDQVSRFVFYAIHLKHLEAAILITVYRPLSADEFMAYWNKYHLHVKHEFDHSYINIIKFLLTISGEFDGDFSDCSEEVQADGTVLHQFPEPLTYERIAALPDNHATKQILSNHFIARKILAIFFGIPFTSTKVRYDSDCIPLWREVTGVVNFFLDLRGVKHQVAYKEIKR